MNKKTELAFIILTIILAACTAQTAPALTELTSLPPTPTTLPSATARPTAVPTVTPTPLSPDAQALKDIVFSDCIPVEEGLPEGFEIPWNLLVMQDGAVYIYDPENGIKVEIPHFSEKTSEDDYKFLNGFYISPDGNWLTYPDLSDTKLFVESMGTLLTNGDTKYIIWDKGDWFHIVRWMDNNTILAIYQPLEEGGFYQTVLFNPFTGEESVFLLEELPNYLDIYFGGVLYITHYLNGGELVPSPTGNRLIYPEWSDSEVFVTNTLWDVKNSRSLARLPFMGGIINDPLWAEDGSNVLLIGPNPEFKEAYNEEWFLINSNGIVRQVTQFQDIFQNSLYGISEPSRSRDGRLMAFQLYFEEPEKTSRHIVLDLQSNIVEGYCINPSPDWNSNFRSAVWSPDSKYWFIFYTHRSSRDEGVFLVDVEGKAAYQIAQDLDVIGWIVKP
jgi:hypothetical protein